VGTVTSKFGRVYTLLYNAYNPTPSPPFYRTYDNDEVEDGAAWGPLLPNSAPYAPARRPGLAPSAGTPPVFPPMGTPAVSSSSQAPRGYRTSTPAAANRCA